jgi:hypothetical protein
VAYPVFWSRGLQAKTIEAGTAAVCLGPAPEASAGEPCDDRRSSLRLKPGIPAGLKKSFFGGLFLFQSRRQ